MRVNEAEHQRFLSALRVAHSVISVRSVLSADFIYMALECMTLYCVRHIQ